MPRVESNSTKTELTIGDIVSTTDHIHKMTVHSILPNGKAKCHYFIESELQEETYDLTKLTLHKKTKVFTFKGFLLGLVPFKKHEIHALGRCWKVVEFNIRFPIFRKEILND